MNAIAKNGGWFIVGVGLGAMTVLLLLQQQNLNGAISSATSAITGLNSRLGSDEAQVQSALAGQKSAAVQAANPLNFTQGW